MLRSLALAPLFWLLAACGTEEPNVHEPSPNFILRQGMLVIDETGKYSQADLERVIELSSNYATPQDRLKFDMLDGYTIHIVNAKTVDVCRTKDTIADGCADRQNQVLYVADRTCEDRNNTRSTIAHEIGHVISGEDDHDNMDWFGPQGVTAKMTIVTCGHPDRYY